MSTEYIHGWFGSGFSVDSLRIMQVAADAPTRILVVEDDAPLAMLVEQMISGWGYAAMSAYGARTPSRPRVIRPELVLMDVKLKGSMSGIEAAEVIKAEIGCPVAFMTAYGDAENSSRHAPARGLERAR